MFYNIMRSLTRIVFSIFYRIRIVNKDNIPKEGNLILAANHTHFLDPVMLAYTTKRPIHFIGKKELFENKFLASILYRLNAFPVDREGSDLSAIKKSLKILKDQEILGIFPEGTRVSEFDLNNAKSGIGLMALKTDTPVVPIYIDSDYKLFKKIRITVGQPITYKPKDKKPTREEYEEVSQDILMKIYALKES